MRHQRNVYTARLCCQCLAEYWHILSTDQLQTIITWDSIPVVSWQVTILMCIHSHA